jgi:hypothetical protein
MKKTCSALGVAMLCIVISLSALSSAYAESMPVSKTGVDSVRGPVTAAANSSKQYDSRFLEIQKLASRILTTLSLQRKERINTPEDLQIPDNLQFLVSDNPDEPAELILIIRRKGNIISQGVIALLKNNKIYLPASELANIIKFKTTLDIQQGIFEGFFYDQENSFYIDALNNVYELKGIKNSLPSNTAILSDFGNGLGELYIDSEFLNKLWLLKLEFHFSDMSLSINTPKNLPNELILERGKKRKIRGGKKDFKTTGLTYLPNNYKLFSLPYLNITAKSAYDSSREKTTSSIYFRGKNDLFGAQADYNFSFINDEDSFRLDDNRFLLTKKSDYPGGLPLGIKKLELGDIILSPPTKVLSFAEGRGVRVSTLSEERLKEFDETIVSGTATPGWEVEVYNGRNLVGFDIVADDGSYSVSEIPLYYGLNKIKTILYGPEGQKEEKIEDISVSNKMLQPGKTVYELSAVERNKDILPLSEKSKDQEGSFLGEIYVARGINEHISSYATLTNLEFKDDRKTYLTLGSDLSLLNGSGKLELYKDLGGGHAFNTKLVTKYKDINLNLDTTFFSDFESQRAGSGKNRRTFTGSLRAKKQFQINSSNFSLDAGLIRTHSKDGSKDTSVQTAQSAFYRFENGKGPFGIRTLGFGNSNNIRYENGDHRNTSGQVNLRAQLNRNWDLRSYLNYDVSPEFKANDVRLNIAYRDYNRFSGNFDVTRDIDNSITEVGLNASYRFDKLRSGLLQHLHLLALILKMDYTNYLAQSHQVLPQ